MSLWCFLEGMMDGPAAMMVAPLGLKTSPTFDNPLLVRRHVHATGIAGQYVAMLSRLGFFGSI